MATRVRTAVVALTLLSCAALGGAAATYELTAQRTVDTPDRSITVDGQSFTITELARLSPGEDLVLETSAPTGATYSIYLYDADRRIVATTAELRGDDSATLGTANVEPGTYVATIYDDGEFKAILPVVISGYSVTLGVTSAGDSNTSLTVTATLTREADVPRPSAVELVVVDRDTAQVTSRTTMSRATGEYRATVQLAEKGEYVGYVNVRGRQTSDGRRLLLGVSDPTRLRPESRSTQTNSTGWEDETRYPARAANTESPASDGVITPNHESEQATEPARSVYAVSLGIGVLLACGFLWRRY